MPSLRKRVSSYFRQLSFHNEPQWKQLQIGDNSFVNKYLQGEIRLRVGPDIKHGKTAADLPSLELGAYKTGPGTITGCYTGPNGGLTCVKRKEKHLSLPDQEDIDFIDTAADEVAAEQQQQQQQRKKSQTLDSRRRAVDNSTMVIKVAGQSYHVTNACRKHSKSHSLGSMKDFEIEKTKRIVAGSNQSNNNHNDNNNCDTSDLLCDNSLKKSVNYAEEQPKQAGQVKRSSRRGERSVGGGIGKSKSDGDPFGHRTGKVTRLERPAIASANSCELPEEWNRKADFVFGISDSLYDKNPSTKTKNGNPIADCFGVIARDDSAILAVADGVNWGEKAAIAAKSAIHGCLHYLNKTVFLDTQPFDNLVISSSQQQQKTSTDTPIHEVRTASTRDLFVCLLRAFNCAHDLILENNGMLTTLTVAAVLPLKTRDPRTGNTHVCCVCNVGDSLAYVYSARTGVREVTRGSHDISANRDMRDALGALGPVDGINPELSNLTLSVTTVDRGDLVLVASDGLTDNMDPTVCRFAVNADSGGSTSSSSKGRPQTAGRTQAPSGRNAAHGFLRSRTALEMRPRRFARDANGTPYVTAQQRYEMTLLLIEDIVRRGIAGKERASVWARRSCEDLVSFTFSLTSAKRHSLEDVGNYYETRDGVLVELSAQERKARRKKALDRAQKLPGKLDHVTVVAWNVAGVAATQQQQ